MTIYEFDKLLEEATSPEEVKALCIVIDMAYKTFIIKTVDEYLYMSKKAKRKLSEIVYKYNEVKDGVKDGA